MKAFFETRSGATTAQSGKPLLHLIPVPLEQTTSFVKGCVRGPQVILETSNQIETYDMNFGFDTLELIEAHTDLELPKLIDNEKQQMRNLEAIASRIRHSLDCNAFPVALGGEHTISLPIIQTLTRKYGSFHVVQIDAHADLYPEYDGMRIHHATIFHHISENHPLSQVGVRVMNSIECESVTSGKVRQLPFSPEPKSLAEIKNFLDDIKEEQVYISLDLDSIDPAFMPCVGTPVSGGLSPQLVRNTLKYLFSTFDVIGVDIVEFCPQNNEHASSMLATEITYFVMGAFAMKF